MIKAEKNLLEFIERKIVAIMMAAIAIGGILVRIPLFKFVSGDMSGYLIVWYDTIKAYGGIHALNIQVGNYSVLYQTLIALMTYIPLSPVILYKSLSVVFDYVMAVAVARFVYEETGKNINKAVFSFAMVLLSPIVIMNSAMWGQCDSIFTSFLVLTVFYFKKEKYPLAFLMYGLAFSFKLQAVFLLPFLLFAYLRKKNFSIINFLITPLVMFVVTIPAIVMGRSWKAAFAVYWYQTKSCNKLYFSYPSFWALLVEHQEGKIAAVEYMKLMFVLLTVFVLAMFMFYMIRKGVEMKGDNILFVAFLFVYTCVLFLPGMHDRYGFPYEILAVPICFKERKTIPPAIALLCLTIPVYGQEFFGGRDVGTVMGLINTLIYLAYAAVLLKRMTDSENAAEQI